jgi:Icc-related predicted phosphoesterase
MWGQENRVPLSIMDVQGLPSLLQIDSVVERRVRIAATGDLHIRGTEDLEAIPGLRDIADRADLLLVAGDITESGRVLEAEAAGALLAAAGLPVIAVLGNHDLRTLRRTAFRRVLERAGVEILDGGTSLICLRGGIRVGVAGATGSGGGFWPMEGPDAVHSRAFKRLALRAHRECRALQSALSVLDADLRIVTTHFAPTTSTLGAEPLAKYWMLGNCELGAVVDRQPPDLVVHGHAHLGVICGRTPGGVPVRNVALPVVGRVYVESMRIHADVARARSGAPSGSLWR